MANPNAPVGGRSLSTLIAADFNSKVHTYHTSTSDATPLFTGDYVKLTGLSNVDGIPYVTQATANDELVGLVVGIKNIFTNEYQIYRGAYLDLEIEVLDDPYADFELQVSGLVTASYVGKKANLLVGAGSTFTGLSGMQLDVATVGSGKQFRIIGVLPRGDNALGMYTKVRCMIASHAYSPSGTDTIPFTGTYYVDVNRTDTYTADGSEAYPFKTIQAAVNAAAITVLTGGVSIRIAPGIYVENVLLENDNLRSVSLMGDGTGRTIIQPASGTAVQSNAHNSGLHTVNMYDIACNSPVNFLGAATSFLSIGGTLDKCTVVGNLVANTAALFTVKNTTVTGAINLTNITGAVALTNSTAIYGLDLNNVLTNASFCFFGYAIDLSSFCTFWTLGCVMGGALSCSGTWYSTEDLFQSGSVMTVPTGGRLERSSSIVQGNTVNSGGTINQPTEPVSSCIEVVAHAGGGQALATHAYARIINVTTVASQNDSILLKYAKAGDWCIVYNAGNENVAVYCQSGEYMDGFLDEFHATAPGSSIYIFYCVADAHWLVLSGGSIPP